tara:strand:+ start:201 stop:566 length:366 start_codon:yes stop_codon:yes gene_type:complete
MTDNYDSGFPLVLSDHEKDKLIHHYKTEAYPDWIANWLPKDVDPSTGLYTDESEWAGEEYEEMHYDGIQFEEGGRMFDLCMHFVDGKVWVDVYECDWEGDNWTTNCRHSWTLTEEIDNAQV